MDGEFGIRIENVLLIKTKTVKPKCTYSETLSFDPFLGFEHVTLVPIGRNLLDMTILDDEEIEWINEYHKECLEKVGPLLEKGSLGLDWLKRETFPLKK